MTFPLVPWLLGGLAGVLLAGLLGDGAAALALVLFVVALTITRHRHRARVARAERRRRLREAAHRNLTAENFDALGLPRLIALWPLNDRSGRRG